MMRLDEMRHAMGDDASFPATGASEQQQRTFNVGHCFALLRIEACKKIHEGKALIA